MADERIREVLSRILPKIKKSATSEGDMLNIKKGGQSIDIKIMPTLSQSETNIIE